MSEQQTVAEAAAKSQTFPYHGKYYQDFEVVRAHEKLRLRCIELVSSRDLTLEEALRIAGGYYNFIVNGSKGE